MTTCTITSWNNTNPVQFDDFDAAIFAAKARAAAERSLIHVIDDLTDECRDVGADGSVGKPMYAA